MNRIELEVLEIQDMEHLEMLKLEWNNLVNKSTNPEICSTYEWIVTWWKCLGSNKHLFVLVVKSGNEIIGIAPFMKTKERFFGLPITKIEFISMGKYADSPASVAPSLDFIISEQHDAVIKAIISFLTKHNKRWHFIRLHPIPVKSQTVLLLEKEAGNHSYVFKKHVVLTHAIVNVDTNWQDYASKLSKSFWKNLRRRNHRLEQLGHVEIKDFKSPDDILKIFPEIMGIEKRSWKWNIGVSINSTAFGNFYKEFALEASKLGQLQVWLLQVNNKYIAYDYNILYQGHSLIVKGSYDSEYYDFSPGNILIAHEFKHYFCNGIKQINLLWGYLNLKRRWLPKIEEFYEVFIFNNMFYSRLLHLLMFKLSLYSARRFLINYRNRLLRKLNIRIKNSELTRLDQLKHN